MPKSLGYAEQRAAANRIARALLDKGLAGKIKKIDLKVVEDVVRRDPSCPTGTIDRLDLVSLTIRRVVELSNEVKK